MKDLKDLIKQLMFLQSEREFTAMKRCEYVNEHLFRAWSGNIGNTEDMGLNCSSIDGIYSDIQRDVEADIDSVITQIVDKISDKIIEQIHESKGYWE